MVDYVKHPRSVRMSLVKDAPITRCSGTPAARVSLRKGGATVSLVKSLY